MNSYSELHNAFLVIISAQAGATGVDTLLTDPVPTGRLWEIHHISFSDLTNAVTNAKTLVRGMGEDFLIDKLANPGAGYPANWLGQNLHIREGLQIGVTIVGATEDDELRLYVHGHEVSRVAPTHPEPAEV